MAGGLRKLFGGQRFVKGIADVHLRIEARSRRIGIFVHLDDIAGDVLDLIIMLPISDARGNPREELCQGAVMIGPGFGEPLAGDLDVEVLSAGKLESGRQVDGLEEVCLMGWSAKKRGRE